ncbi:hypothetical protein KJZ99_00185 [bacterium]|nr:hypothetical protein [bacterium]
MKYDNWKIIGFDESKSKLVGVEPAFFVEVLHARHRKLTTEFVHRWQHLLSGKNPLFRQFCLAYCLAATGGDVSWKKFRPELSLNSAPPPPAGINRHDWFAEHGIAALPLCQLAPQYVTNYSDLLNVQNSFEILEALCMDAFEGHRDVCHAALIVHRQGITRNPEKLFDVSYRGTFLPDFINYFNMIGIILTERNSAHERQI